MRGAGEKSDGSAAFRLSEGRPALVQLEGGGGVEGKGKGKMMSASIAAEGLDMQVFRDAVERAMRLEGAMHSSQMVALDDMLGGGGGGYK